MQTTANQHATRTGRAADDLALASRINGAAQRYLRALETGDELDVLQALLGLDSVTSEAVRRNALLQPNPTDTQLPALLRRQA